MAITKLGNSMQNTDTESQERLRHRSLAAQCPELAADAASGDERRGQGGARSTASFSPTLPPEIDEAHADATRDDLTPTTNTKF